MLPSVSSETLGENKDLRCEGCENCNRAGGEETKQLARTNEHPRWRGREEEQEEMIVREREVRAQVMPRVLYRLPLRVIIVHVYTEGRAFLKKRKEHSEEQRRGLRRCLLPPLLSSVRL